MKKAELYTLSAYQCNADGQVILAFCYQKGIGVEKDMKKAIELYTLSADQGNSDAQRRLAEIKKKAIEL